MTDRPAPSSFGFVLVIIGMGLVAALTTLFVGYTIGPSPLGFIGWLVICFLCFIELLFSILGVNGLVGRRRRKRPSGAVLLITYGVVFVYAAAGLTSILLYSMVRGESGAGDRAFLAILLAETVLAFLVVTLMYAYDIFLASASEETLRARDRDFDDSRSLRSALSALRALDLSDDDLLRRREALTKTLSTMETALAHSHGGGVGSREAGWQHPRDPAAERDIEDAMTEIDVGTRRLDAAEPDALAHWFGELEESAARLRHAVERLELL